MDNNGGPDGLSKYEWANIFHSKLEQLDSSGCRNIRSVVKG